MLIWKKLEEDSLQCKPGTKSNAPDDLFSIRKGPELPALVSRIEAAI